MPGSLRRRQGDNFSPARWAPGGYFNTVRCTAKNNICALPRTYRQHKDTLTTDLNIGYVFFWHTLYLCTGIYLFVCLFACFIYLFDCWFTQSRIFLFYDAGGGRKTGICLGEYPENPRIAAGPSHVRPEMQPA